MMTRSTHFVHVAKNLLNVLQGYTKGIRFMLIMFLTLTVITHAWGAETVTYTVSSTSAVEISGTAPTGSSAIYNSTYKTAYQLTADNSMTLTLSGYDGCQITGLTLRMRSNASGGAGNMSMKIGSTTVSSISTAKFNTNSWYGSWSTSYVDIAPSVTATTVGDGENVVIIIAATANSLYCQSFTLTYEPAEGSDNPSTDDCEVMYDFTKINDWSKWESSYTKHEVTYSDAIVTFSSANKQTTTITDCPVTKGNDVSLVMTDGSTLSGVEFMCKQWGGKAQTITLNYSTDGGKNYTSTGITSTNFTISSNNLPIGTNAVKITFSSTSDQVGISSCTIQKVCITETTVSLNLNGGTFEVEPEGWGNNAGTYIQNIMGGEEITLPTPTKNGYTFIGWSDGTNSFSGTYIVPTEEVTLYAQWQEILVSNNCRWIETEIEDIQPEDEVLITMKRLDNGNTYTLDHSKGTSALPPAQIIAIDGYEATFLTLYHSNSIWNISGNATDGYILYPNGSTTTWLYCTKSNNNVKVGTTTNNVFTIDNGYLRHTNTDWIAYLGIYIDGANTFWRHHNSPNVISIANQSLKFYKKTCLPSNEFWVDYDLAGGENGCANGSVKEGNDYTICDAKPTKTGYTFQHWTDGTNTYEAGATIENVQSNITLTAVWEANTYTITWMSNGEEYATTTHTYNQPLEIPSEPYTCYGTKTFIGWTEADNVSEDGGGITYVDDSTNPSANKTYYAIFADEVISEPDEVEATLSFANTSQRTSFSTTQQVWEQNGIELTNTQGSGNNGAHVADYANPARFYAHSSINILAPGNITKVVFVCSGESYAAPMEESAGNSATSDGTNVTVFLDGSSNTFDIASVTAQVRLSSITVTYQSTPEPITSNYTTTPSGCPDIEVAENAYVTSTSGQSVKVKVPVTISNYFDGITLSANIEGESNFTIANLSSIKEGTATLEIAYKPTAYNTTENATITIVANKGENKVTATDFTVNGRSLPETFAIVAKVGNLWYALPSQGLNSTDALLGYPVEVDNMEDPTAVTSVPTNADWSLRQVYASTGSGDRFTANGNNLVFVNNSDPVKALNASQEGNYLLTDAQYANYYATNPSLYEWIPTTTDLENYTLTNAQRTDRILNVATNTAFGVHSDNKATTEVRFLPITNRYIQAALQVVEWKENSVVVMYNGDPAQTASVSVNGATAQETVLSAAQRDIAVYELTANGLATNPIQRLSITIGTEKTILSIPYIISGSKTDKEVLPGSTVSAQQEAAKIADLVVLNGATLTAAGAKGNPYKFRNVTVYGGGKLVIPSEKGFGVNTLTLRISGVTSEGNYDYVYPEFVLNTQYEGAYSNTSGKINLDYVTTKEQYYTFVAPFAVQTKDIKYPVEIYGSNVAANNRGSFEFQYYDGAARAAGERGWKVVEEDPANGATLTAHQGYTFYGMPKKVSVNGGTSTRQKFGIHRIPMSVKAADAMTHENNEQTVAVAAYPAEKKINAGWNLIGNPYMSTITGLDNQSILTGTIVLTDDRWQWSDQGTSANRFIVFPSDDGECYYTSQASNATLPAFKNFFVQISQNVNTLSIPYASRTSPSQAPAHRTAQEIDEDIELAIVLEQDEQQADQMDFLLNDTYSALYDHNADFTKMMNNTNLNLFGVYMDDKLSFVAMDRLSAQRSVAIGYQVPQAGQYTLRLSDKPYVMWSRVEAIYVTDHEVTPKITTNLLNDPYTFQVATAETNTTRFTISIVPSKESGGTTTAVDNLLYQDIHTQKIIYNDQLYILSDGVVYDARGQRIMTINK